MPNQPSPYKRTLNVLIKRESIAKLDHLHNITGFSRNSLVDTILEENLSHIKLTSEELEKLNNEIEQAKRA